jgi:gamma-glutamyltranspeptidase / glutathione hydrolase
VARKTAQQCSEMRLHVRGGSEVVSWAMTSLSRCARAAGLAWLALVAVATPATALTPVGARHGMVVTSSAPATDAGVEMLRRGGNAVDAAVAVGFALAVTHPTAGNIGGGGFMLVRMADGRVAAIDYRETAPAAATRDMYLDAQGNVIPRASRRGPRAAGVPGTVAGLALALQRYGTMDLASVMRPAIALARRGFPVSYSIYRAIAEQDQGAALADFRSFPASAHVYLRNGEALAVGDTLRQPDLAWALEQIARGGTEAFYKGAIAERIERAMKRDGGIITRADLAAYKPVVREPMTGTYRGCTIQTMPLPSSGGIVLIGMLRALETEDVAGLGHNSAAFIHRFAEIANRYYADRAWFLGDPDFVKAPVSGLASRAYAAEVRARIDTARHTPAREITHGDSAWLWRASAAREESHETTHFCVVDRAGNAVSNTYTLNESFGSRYVVEGAGFLLNDEMDDFSIEPGVPNVYGLVGGTANAIAPGKRMLSSMAPTIVTRDGKLFLVIGSPGGSRIITSICEAMINVIDHGMNVADAVGASRFHSQWLPDRVDIEPFGFPHDVVVALEARGHKVDDRYGWWSQVHAIQLDATRGLLLGASDPRAGDGKAAGY